MKSLWKWLGSPAVPASLLRRVGRDDELLYQAVRWNLNRNDSALYSLLHGSRIVQWGARHAGARLTGATLLEIGTSTQPGLPFALLMHGARRYFANNILPVDDSMSEGYAKLIAMMFAPFAEDLAERTKSIVKWETDARGVRRARFRPERFANYSPVAAEDVDLPDDSVDAAFSLAVLEHVEHPRAVLANAFRVLKPGGWCVHAIDLRDHRDFREPFRFLREEDREYEAACPRGPNRLRAGDWIEGFRGAGYEIIGVEFIDAAMELDAKGDTDAASQLFDSARRLEPADALERRKPRLTGRERAAFSARFRGRSLADLSQKAITVVARKPG